MADHATAGAGAPSGDRLADWITLLHDRYPPAHAEPWDAVGLHVGDLAEDTVRGVLVALDVTRGTLQEAADVGADLLVAHHPLLFRPLGRLTADTAPGRLALQAARAGIAVAAAHTNVDKAVDGTSHPAAAVLGLVGLRPLDPLPAPALAKLVTFVPTAHSEAVRAALAEVGAGRIGDYDGCSFRTAGTGAFRPGAGTSPSIGRPGELEEVQEDRLEVVLPESLLPVAMAALQAVHPYEEVPVDRYPLLPDAPSAERGLGVVGDLPAPTPVSHLRDALAEGLRNPLVRLAAEDRDAPVTRVAVVGGAGGSHADQARRAGAQVLVTGDVGHHVALDAMAMGLAVIDAGHFGTEWMAMRALADGLRAAAQAQGLAAAVHLSQLNTDPWTDWT